MRLITFVLFSLFSSLVKGEIIKLKFHLISDIDSAIIKLDEVKLTPIKSNLVEEIEHHEGSPDNYFFKNFKIYHDPKISCNIFEYEATEYPFKDIYLRISSDSFYYHRPLKSDYDETNTIHLNADSVSRISKIYLTRYRFTNIYKGFDTNSDKCIEISIWTVIENDTIKARPIYKKFNQYATESLTRTVAINKENKYLILVENYSKNKYTYCYSELNWTDEYVKNLNLSDLNYLDYPYFGKSKNCVKYSKVGKSNSIIQYY